MLIPAEAWHGPANDATYSGFDRNVVYTSGNVSLSHAVADMVGQGRTPARLSLATTLRRTFNASVDIVFNSYTGTPGTFRIGVWSPWTRSGVFIDFGSPPGDALSISTIRGGSPGAILSGGEGTQLALGAYRIGQAYRLRLFVDRTAGQVRAEVTGLGSSYIGAVVTRDDLPELFGNVQLALTASADAGSGTSDVTLSQYKLYLPHERAWTTRIEDNRATAALLSLALLSLLAATGALFAARKRVRLLRLPRVTHSASYAIGFAILYLIGNAALFPVGGHPFDFANERLYAYVAQAYSPSELYFLPDVVSFAGIWGGTPWVQATFPYEPVTAYFFTAIGWATRFLFAGGQTIDVQSIQLGYAIKAVNVVFGLADAALIYTLLRDFNVTMRWSRIGAALFLFNPAVWFNMSVWGQTHVISIFFTLLAILFAQRSLPFWAWLSLAAACLTRPQMLVFGVLVGVVLLRKFSWRENIMSVSWALLVMFVLITPLLLATSPSLPVDVIINNFRIQEAGGNEATLTTVSQDAYSIWPLLTYLVNGASSLQRSFTPSADHLVGGITYQTAGQLLTILALAVTVGAILTRKRDSIQSGGYIPLVAVGVTSFLMFLTGIVSTHFLLGLPLLILCRRWMDPIPYLFVVVVWTVSTFVPMFGDMGVAMAGRGYAFLGPEHNAITRFFVGLYAWDRFITVAIVANICVLAWLAEHALRPQPAPTPAPAL